MAGNSSDQQIARAQGSEDSKHEGGGGGGCADEGVDQGVGAGGGGGRGCTGTSAPWPSPARFSSFKRCRRRFSDALAPAVFPMLARDSLSVALQRDDGPEGGWEAAPSR